MELETELTIRGRYILDGAANLHEAADMARAYADYLDGLHENGFELQGIINNDYAVAAPK